MDASSPPRNVSRSSPFAERGRFVRDLVALSGLPAIWTRANPSEIAESLAQLILSVTDVDGVSIVLAEPAAEVVHWHSRTPEKYPLTSADLLKLKEGGVHDQARRH